MQRQSTAVPCEDAQIAELAALIEADSLRVLDEIDSTPLQNRTVMITGATGLVGVYLVAALRQVNRVLGRGMMLHTVSQSPPPRYLAPLFSGDDMRHHLADVSDGMACARLPAAGIIIHAAGYGQPGKYRQDPVKTILLNVLATDALMAKLPADGRFLLVSSGEVYSGSTRTPHVESDIGTTDPGHIRASYIEGKRCAEALCHSWGERGRHTRIARLAMAYGPGTRPDDQRVMNSLIRRAIQEGTITLMDQGEARRICLYITDATAMLLNILLHGRERVYNVTGTSSLTVLDMARAIGAALCVPVRLPLVSAGMAGAPTDVALDVTRYGNEFAKTDFVSFADGLARTLSWQQRLYYLLANAVAV